MERSLKILHVDDDRSFLNLAGRKLSEHGIEIVKCTDPQKVEELIAEQDFDCILSDYDMPNKNGLELFKEVRGYSGNIAYILLTENVENSLAEDALSSGIDDFIRKNDLSEMSELVINRIKNTVERRRAGLELEEEREKYSTLVEEAVNGVFIYQNRNIVFANDRGCEMLNAERGELVGSPFIDYLAPEYHEEIVERHERRLRGEDVSQRKVVEVRNANGEIFPVELNLSLIEYEGENAVMGIVRDITDQREREEKILSMNEATQEMINAESRGELTRKAFQAAKELFDLEEIGFKSQELGFLGSETYRNENLIEEAGEKGSPVFDQDYEGDGTLFAFPVGEYGVAFGKTENNDISEIDTRLAQLFSLNVEAAINNLVYRQELEEERDRFAYLFENMPSPVVYVDFGAGEPIVRKVNPEFEEVFGYSSAEAEGRSLNELIVPEGHEIDAERVDSEYLSEKQVVKEVVRQAEDGLRDFIMTGFPASATKDKAYGVYMDITDTKRYQREIERQNEQLEKFAGILSHELRNPLNIAKGYLNTIKENSKSNEYEEIDSALDRMDKIIEEVLSMARQGQSVENKEKINLKKVSEEAWAMIESGTAEIQAEEVEIEADRSRIKQALENLLRNSVEHNQGGIKVKIGETNEGFFVEDNGDGIPEEKRDEVFEYGVSLDEGPGFGLSIVKSIIEAHGWEISVKESENGGARFEIMFG